MDQRSALRATGAAAAIGAPVAAGATWAAVRVLTSAPAPRVRRPTLDVRVLDDAVLGLRGARAADPGSWGLQLSDCFVRIDEPLGVEAGWVRRRYAVLDGTVDGPAAQVDRRRDHRRGDDPSGRPGAPEGSIRPTSRPTRERRRRPGDRRRSQQPPPWPVRGTITPFAWPDDPQVLARHTGATLHIDGVRSGGHTLPVWILQPAVQRSDTWVVGVHGRRSPRTELFRIAAVALAQGHPVLIASYRTDRWTSSPTPMTTLGTVEWRDAEANVAAALARGARRVVLAGCSLGGGLVAQVVRRSALAPWIAGVVLDSPALSWTGLLRGLARRNRVPSLLVGPVMAAARLRAAIDWSMLDHLAAVDEFAQPVLLLHGTDDEVVPIVLSEAFAAARPELVTYLRFHGATHVTSWNHAPLRYEAAVSRFLAERTVTRPPS